MKLQLTKTKTIDLSFGKGGGGRGAKADVVGVELFSDDPRGVPAVRIAYKKSAWHLLGADFIKAPDGELPEKWEDVSHRSTWELPSAFQAPHAAIAVNSRLCLFSQTTADTVLHDMSRGIPSNEPAAAEPGKKRFALRRNNSPAASAANEEEADKSAAKANAKATQLPVEGVPTAMNGMRFTVRPLAEEGQLLEAALPEFLLEGRLTQRNMRKDNGDVYQEFSLNLTMTCSPYHPTAELRGLEIWQKRIPLRKEVDRRNALN